MCILDLYPDLTAPGAGQPTLPDNVQVVQEPTEEQKQEWQAELEKVRSVVGTSPFLYFLTLSLLKK